MDKKIGNKIQLFIVEDDPVQAKILIENILDFEKDVNVKHFISGELLFEYLKTYSKEAKVYYLILDYFLQTESNKEGVNGNEVIKYLEEEYSYIKIILFSAYESDDNLKFESLKDEFSNLIGVIKKSEFGYKTIQNTVRFDYVKELFKIKRKRFAIARIFFIVALVISMVYYFFLQ